MPMKQIKEKHLPQTSFPLEISFYGILLNKIFAKNLKNVLSGKPCHYMRTF